MTKTRLLSFCLGLVLFTASFVSPAYAAEVIHSYHSDIYVEADAQLTVKETIIVNAEGRKIKRGIYRDLPMYYIRDDGTYKFTKLKVLGVKRNGQKEPYFIRRQGGWKRIYIGEKEVHIPHGKHIYEITYSVDRMVGFWDGFDEIYWNVTGNGWAFPIEQASAKVFPPLNAPILQHRYYTGYRGSKATLAEAVKEIDGSMSFYTTKPLRKKQGLTVAVGWPKDYVSPPQGWQKFKYYMRDHFGFWYFLILFMLINVYYFRIWQYVGRDPEKGTIIPRFKAPDGFSPALVCYVMSRGLGGKSEREAFAAAVTNMAVKGKIRITEEGHWRKKYIIRCLDVSKDGLSKGERYLFQRMFTGGDSEFVLEKKYDSYFQKTLERFTKMIEREYKDVYFIKNGKYSGWGFGITLACSLFLPIFVNSMYIWGWVLFGGIWASNLIYYFLLEAPTMEGRRVMDEIEGLELYLTVAEKDRLDFLHPPEMTPEVFEKFLPYAIALGVENKWTKNFKKSMPKDVYDRYEPNWYSGRGHFNCSNMTSSLGSSMSSTVSAASTTPGSSGGGGGFSGGGGGGGGGGGW